VAPRTFGSESGRGLETPIAALGRSLAVIAVEYRMCG
jgi:hypothetical protein